VRPALARRSAKLDRIIAEYADDAIVELAAPAALPPESSAAPRVALVDALEETLQWRLRQDSTLGRLVARLPDLDAVQIATSLGVARDGIANAIYKARNLIAHGALSALPMPNSENLLRSRAETT